MLSVYWVVFNDVEIIHRKGMIIVEELMIRMIYSIVFLVILKFAFFLITIYPHS